MSKANQKASSNSVESGEIKQLTLTEVRNADKGLLEVKAFEAMRKVAEGCTVSLYRVGKVGKEHTYAGATPADDLWLRKSLRIYDDFAPCFEGLEMCKAINSNLLAQLDEGQVKYRVHNSETNEWQPLKTDRVAVKEGPPQVKKLKHSKVYKLARNPDLNEQQDVLLKMAKGYTIDLYPIFDDAGKRAAYYGMTRADVAWLNSMHYAVNPANEGFITDDLIDYCKGRGVLFRLYEVK